MGELRDRVNAWMKRAESADWDKAEAYDIIDDQASEITRMRAQREADYRSYTAACDERDRLTAELAEAKAEAERWKAQHEATYKGWIVEVGLREEAEDALASRTEDLRRACGR